MRRASIIIPTCNRREDLRRCVGRLIPQLPADGSVEIRVCDDSSGDDSKKMLAAEFHSVAWSQGPRKGPAANRNMGSKLSESEWLIFIDDDCIPREGYVAAYIDAFDSPDSSGLFHGLTFPLPEPTSLLYEAPSIKEPQTVFGSCNFAIRRELFDANGGFDERYFPAFEDIEFFSRLRRLGINAQCVWRAAVDHPLRPIPNSRKLAARWEARVVSSMDLGAKPRDIYVRLPKHVLLVIISRFRAANARLNLENTKAARIFAGEFLYFLSLMPSWIRKHAKEPRSRFWTEQVALGKAPPRFGL
jgi:GT2 family glycosyltransferase